MALGTIFDGFWRVVGAHVGTKLAPKSKKMECQDNVKKLLKILSREGPRGLREGRPWSTPSSPRARLSRHRISPGLGGAGEAWGGPGRVYAKNVTICVT